MSPDMLRACLSKACAAAIFSAPAYAAEYVSNQAPTASIANGSYEGVYNSPYDQDFFLGMPYAKPPTGDLRLRVPQSLSTSWTGARNDTEYGPICLGTGQTGETSEDCLTINVIRPAGVDSNSNLPVAVWIYGGGFVSDGSAMQQYNLSFIVHESVQMDTPVIAVSLNYRLHCWGYMWSSEIYNEGVANLGFRDQRLALHWTQENIAAVPATLTNTSPNCHRFQFLRRHLTNRVTIWGESAGAHSVGVQMTAYGGRNDGLFCAAISQNGAPSTYSRYQTMEDWQPYYDAVVEAADCSSAENTLACLRALETDNLLSIFQNDTIIPSHTLTGTTGPQFVSVVDGDFIQESGTTQPRDGKFVNVPYIIGANSGEGTRFSTKGAVNTTADSTTQLLGWRIDNTTATSLRALYPDIPEIGVPKTMDGRPAADYGAQYKRSAAYGGDINIHAPRRFASQMWAESNVTVYSYYFDVVTTVAGPYNGAPHGAEIPFVFNNLLGTGYTQPTNVFTDGPETFKDWRLR